MSYSTIRVRFEDPICFLQFDRPTANNTINALMVSECSDALAECERRSTVVVFSGSPEVFCLGADFGAFVENRTNGPALDEGPGAVYDLWLRMATAPFITLAHVQGKVNAGGVGFVAASDIVLADVAARFSLSEMLFGLYPACVLPFLVRRVGFQRAHYLTLSTQTITAARACEWGLVDVCEAPSEALLRRHLVRLRRTSKVAVERYKRYANGLVPALAEFRSRAVEGNLEVFTDAANQRAIARYLETGVFPWETS
jgi:polyketide biosynthesis enoyl-CoA hydratase PksH